MRVLVFGDSTTYHSAIPSGGWVDYLRRDFEKSLLENKSDEHIPEVYNLGISGDTSEGLLRRLDTEVQARKWYKDELAIAILIGVNDSKIKAGKEYSTPEEYKSNLQQILDKSSNYTNRILLIGLTAVDESRTRPVAWGDTTYINERIRAFDKQIQDVAKENNIPYVPLHNKFLKHPELLYDGAHQTAEGHQIIANTVKTAIEQLVK
jgi:lysophospholipase L1-like esterase